ncbi:DPH3 homolog isoform X1 [Falco naumanni]|uniref:DPH3 homolog isoform X1 n=1 Tax=Falco rusticolus TaxID=120794 RepID=UPI0018865F48|nr:DPH3 homolog isoform X1 [Falco rusticolus]XP_040446987.1 DPH3 homolog isoform X1 [Falco naumanni]XP_055564721.1 diphthamide biosynthesis protein 3 isoform X1 [Falco cherrug]
MSVFHDEVEIEDFEYDEETETYSYPCPCGDRFLITREDLENGEDVATCPSCSLILRVIYDQIWAMIRDHLVFWKKLLPSFQVKVEAFLRMSQEILNDTAANGIKF